MDYRARILKSGAGVTQCPIQTSKVLERNHSPLKEIDILWITASLGCDGESIAMTAATQPSVEDLVLGAIPGIPLAIGEIDK
jgi:hypothetical protein